jgi:hypothetical protein
MRRSFISEEKIILLLKLYAEKLIFIFNPWVTKMLPKIKTNFRKWSQKLEKIPIVKSAFILKK